MLSTKRDGSYENILTYFIFLRHGGKKEQDDSLGINNSSSSNSGIAQQD